MIFYDNVCDKQGGIELEFKTSLLNSRAIGTGERAVGPLIPPLLMEQYRESVKKYPNDMKCVSEQTFCEVLVRDNF